MDDYFDDNDEDGEGGSNSRLPFAHDIALLLLDKPVSTSRPLIRLPPKSREPPVKAGTRLTAIGWGWTKQGVPPEVLQQVTIPLHSVARCKKLVPDMKALWQLRHSICAGSEEQGINTNDSGGPLFVRGSSADKDMLVGITSFNSPADGFVNVAAYRGWIDRGLKILLNQTVLTPADRELYDINAGRSGCCVAP